jgi:hypothetical protein
VTKSRLNKEIRAQHRVPYKGDFIDNCYSQEAAGYPKALETLRSWPTEKLYAERSQLVRDSFGLFGYSALKLLAVVEKVIAERQQILAGLKE